jgi:hypothetical protein
MRLRSLCTALVVLACRKPAPSVAPPRDAAPPRAPADAPRPVADASQPPEAPRVVPRLTPPPGVVRPDAGVRRRTTAARAAPVNVGDPWAITTSPAGALWVRAVNRPGQRASDIVATVMGHDGAAIGEPRLVRRTTGPVVSVSVDAVGPHVWIAWHTVRAPADSPNEEHIVAALHGDADLGEVGAPVTLATFSRQQSLGDDIPYVWPGAMARVFVRDDGGGLVVSTGPRATCVHGEEEHSERVPCEGWNVSRVELNGDKRVHAESVICAVGLPGGFVRVPGGIAYSIQDDHIASKILTFTESLGAAPEVTLPSGCEAWRYGGASMAWGDGAFALNAAFAENLDGQTVATRGVCVRAPTANTTNGRDAFGGELMPELRTSPLRCVDGHPVVRVRWRGGPANGVVFDPTHPGTSIDLAAWADLHDLPLPAGVTEAPSALVWAGAALVGVTQGALTRWRCAPNGALRLVAP